MERIVKAIAPQFSLYIYTFIALLITWEVILVVSKRKSVRSFLISFRNRIGVIMSYLIVGFIGAILAIGYWWGIQKIFVTQQSQGSQLFVFPSSYTVSPSKLGLDEELVLKVMNDHDYPLHKVQIKIRVDSGDIPLEDIFISPDGKYRQLSQFGKAPGELLREGPSKDAIRVTFYGIGQNGSTVISDVMPYTFSDQKQQLISVDIRGGWVGASEVYVRKKEGTIYKIFFIEEIDAHQTKHFPMIIHKARCTSKSNLSFTIRGSCKNPLPVYKKPAHQRIIVPIEGHHTCE